MSQLWAEARFTSRLTRRRLLGLAAGSLAAEPSWAAVPAASARRTARWPTARLRSADARRVDTSQFMAAGQLLAWHRELDALGLRATGSPVHEHYIDVLRGRLERAGVDKLHFESVPHRRWLAESWSLHASSSQGAQQIPTAAYIPYSGGTRRGGTSGPLVALDPAATPPAPGSLRGKIVLFSLPASTLTFGALGALAYKSYDPAGLLKPGEAYTRSWLSISTLIAILDSLVTAQASGCVCVLDLPPDAAHGAYYPYDGKVRGVPGLFVDRATGVHLRRLATRGARVRLELRSRTRDTKTRNLIGLIPGESDELMLLHSHTDGPNAIEDNGPNAIVAISQYLTRLPRRSLPRSVMVLLTTGHFPAARLRKLDLLAAA